MKKRVKLTCKGCKSKHWITIDTEALDYKKLTLDACYLCPETIRKVKFKGISKHGMKPKKIKVGKIYLTAEIKPIQSKRYK